MVEVLRFHAGDDIAQSFVGVRTSDPRTTVESVTGGEPGVTVRIIAD